jgi:hypothetical protein
MALHFCQWRPPRIIFRVGSKIGSRFQWLVSGRPTGTVPYIGGVSACAIAFAIALLTQAARAEDAKDSWADPLVCSPLKSIPPELKDYCTIEPLPKEEECHPISPGAECHKIKVKLTAKDGRN